METAACEELLVAGDELL